MADTTPTYIAYCVECGGVIGASVADPHQPESLKYAVADRRQWLKRGHRVETKTVQDVRDYKPPLGHLETCRKARRRARTPQAATKGQAQA